ncbi:MAG: histidinol-phosphatase [Rhodobacteraceae bacterium]|nr:histidinol-phosphatase [Paracoccaceae bacterium]
MTASSARPVTLSAPDRAALVAAAHAAADAAAAAILPYFRMPGLTAENKAAEGARAVGFDPVTAADRASEQAMREVLARLRPGDAILGEEYGAAAGTSGLTWVLDPIDGTRSFLAGTPVWGVLVAVCDPSGPVFGVIDQPFTGERWTGGFGQADWRRGDSRRPIATRKTAALLDAILFSTFPEVGTPDEAAAFRRLSAQCRLTRYGLDCYAYALLAMGQIDLVVEAGLHAYDVAAPIALIEAAGGVVTDWTGRPVHAGGRVLAAANAGVHAAALAVLSDVP